jgi:hypothetical protein
MQNKFLAGIFFFIILAIPLSRVHATYYCVGIFCSNPYSSVDQDIQQTQIQNQLQSSQQSQSVQNTENRLMSQYGLSAYNSCTSNMLHIDQGNMYEVASYLNMDETCMESYVAKQKAQTTCTSDPNASWSSYYGQCQCNAGYEKSKFNGLCYPIVSAPTIIPVLTSNSFNSSLTSNQINSILSLLSSFGASATTIANVKAAMVGQ